MSNIKKFLSDPQLWDKPDLFSPDRLHNKFYIKNYIFLSFRFLDTFGKLFRQIILSLLVMAGECAWENPWPGLSCSSSLYPWYRGSDWRLCQGKYPTLSSIQLALRGVLMTLWWQSSRGEQCMGEVNVFVNNVNCTVNKFNQLTIFRSFP